MLNGEKDQRIYPLLIARSLQHAERACRAESTAGCHDAVLGLANAISYYLGAVAVGQYSQALYTGQIEADPTLNRSLRSLRRVLPGQWLLWAARGLATTPGGPIVGLAEWYAQAGVGTLAGSYSAVRDVMVAQLDYAGEYGMREEVSPRLFLELLDQYRVRRSKLPGDVLPLEAMAQVGSAVFVGLSALLDSATFLSSYPLYAPQQRRLLMGPEATVAMPPLAVPDAAAETATLLLYPPGEKPDYTKRPTLQAERLPLFPLDPLVAYLYCRECDDHRVAALREVVAGTPSYQGLDPQCDHAISAELR